jgi:hypothetical protein
MAAIDYRPPMCSEREPGGFEDCTWCAGVMLNNAAHAKTVAPSTRSEYEGLRVDGGNKKAEGHGDGSDLFELRKGIKKRYGFTPRLTGEPGSLHKPWTTVLKSLAKPGDAAVLQGSMGVFPAGHHLRRHDKKFDGAHAVYVQRVDDKPRLWWMNPAAPNSFDGEFIALADAKKYYQGLRGGAMFVRVGEQNAEADMPGLATTPGDDLVVGMARIPAGVEVINVETRKRVEIGANGATRQAVGPFTRDFGDVAGYFIRHRDPDEDVEDLATYWVSKASCVFTQTGT